MSVEQSREATEEGNDDLFRYRLAGYELACNGFADAELIGMTEVEAEAFVLGYNSYAHPSAVNVAILRLHRQRDFDSPMEDGEPLTLESLQAAKELVERVIDHWLSWNADEWELESFVSNMQEWGDDQSATTEIPRGLARWRIDDIIRRTTKQFGAIGTDAASLLKWMHSVGGDISTLIIRHGQQHLQQSAKKVLDWFHK